MIESLKTAAAPMSIILFKKIILADNVVEDIEISKLLDLCKRHFDLTEEATLALFDSAPLIDDLELFAAQAKHVFSKEMIAETHGYVKEIAEYDGACCDREKAAIEDIKKAFA